MKIYIVKLENLKYTKLVGVSQEFNLHTRSWPILSGPIWNSIWCHTKWYLSPFHSTWRNCFQSNKEAISLKYILETKASVFEKHLWRATTQVYCGKSPCDRLLEKKAHPSFVSFCHDNISPSRKTMTKGSFLELWHYQENWAFYISSKQQHQYFVVSPSTQWVQRATVASLTQTALTTSAWGHFTSTCHTFYSRAKWRGRAGFASVLHASGTWNECARSLVTITFWCILQSMMSLEIQGQNKPD